MRMFLGILGVAAGLAGPIAAQPASDYRDDDQLARALREAVAGREKQARLSSLGESSQGRPIWTVELGSSSGTPRDQRPGLLVVSNLGGDRPVADEVLVGMIETILARSDGDEKVARLLDQHVLYFVPRPNPDATQSFFTAPRHERRLTATPVDHDRDGRVDEDGPDDLNGDGLITQMRVTDPEGEWLIDEDDPRRMRKADPTKGERGTHRLLIEGQDDDGDGEYNEDPAGGVDLDRNFAHGWEEHDRSTGDYPNCESTSKALIDWVLAHRNIAMVWVLDRHDNLVQAPRGGQPQRGGGDDDGPGRGRRRSRGPVTEIQGEDLRLYQTAGEKFRELLGVDQAEAAPADGAFHAWAYFQYGVPAFASRVWYGPEKESSEASEEEAAGEEGGGELGRRPERSSGRRGRGGSRGGPEDDPEAAWLAWNDRALGGNGFVAWTEHEHPQLGQVEIGGWKPFAKTTPPTDRIADLVTKHTDFLQHLGEQFARVRITEVEVEDHGGGFYTVEAVITNEGRLPTAIQQGQVNREVMPVLVELELHGQTVELGEARDSFGSLGGHGDRRELTWMIRGEPGSRVTLKVEAQKAGSDRREIRLGE